MADAKLTALAELAAQPDITDLLYIVDDVSGTPTSKKIEVRNLLFLEFGQIYVSDGAATQDVSNVTPTKVTQFAANGVSSGGVTPDHANDKITVTNPGIYLVIVSCSFSGTNASTLEGSIFWNNVQQVSVKFERKLGNPADVGSATTTGLVDVTSGSTDFDLRVIADTNNDDFDLQQGSLTVIRIGNT